MIPQKERKNIRKTVNKDKAKVLAEGIYYLLNKWDDIMEKTGLVLTRNSKEWGVNNGKSYKTVKKGTFAQCMDYILEQWKKKQ